MNLFMRFEGMDMFLAVKRKRRLSIHLSARELRGQGHLRVNYLEIVFIFLAAICQHLMYNFLLRHERKRVKLHGIYRSLFQ